MPAALSIAAYTLPIGPQTASRAALLAAVSEYTPHDRQHQTITTYDGRIWPTFSTRADAEHLPTYTDTRNPAAILSFHRIDNGAQVEGIASPAFTTEQSSNYHEAKLYKLAHDWSSHHAAAILAAADGAAVSAQISDRSGPVTLLIIEADGEIELGDAFRYCDRCGAVEHEDSTAEVDGSETWCEACSDDHAIRCNDCGELFSETHTTGSGDQVCNTCRDEYFYCHNCDDLEPYENSETLHNERGRTLGTVCHHCIEQELNRDNWHRDQDGDLIDEPEPAPEDDDDDDAQGDNGEHMQRYRYHTDANETLRHSIPDTGHTYGLELEYKGSPTDWPAIAAACRHRAILTDDSTVSGELVSAALTAGTARKYLAAVTAALTGTRNDTATGLHIHVDKRALTAWQWYRLAHYAKTHSSTLEVIAGRTANQWADFKRLAGESLPSFANAWRHAAGDRYSGIGIRYGTAEFRICRATKTPTRALARFGMIQRLVAIGRLPDSAKPNSAELAGWLAQDKNIQTITGWEPNKWQYPTQAQPQPSDAPPWEKPEAKAKAKLKRMQLEAAQLATVNLRNLGWKAEDRMVNAPLNSIQRLRARMEREMAQALAESERKAAHTLTQQLAELEPLT